MSEIASFSANQWFSVTVAGIPHSVANCSIDPPDFLANLAERLRGQDVFIDGKAYRVRDVGGFASGRRLRDIDIMVFERREDS